MGVYIPNIEMPKSCDDCPHPTCTLWKSVNSGERNEKCPISYVPPHGRLIDGDALTDNWYYASAALRPDDVKKVVCLNDIDNAQTIIEEEEDNGKADNC